MNTVANSIFIPDITTIEVMNVILLLKNSGAGWDDIPAYVMKKCINVYIEPLTHIIDIKQFESKWPPSYSFFSFPFTLPLNICISCLFLS